MQPTIWEWPREHRGTIDSTFDLVPTNLSSRSPYTQQRTAYGQSKMFVAKLTFPTKRGPEWRSLKAFVTRLDGISGLLRIVDYHRMKPAWDQFEAKPTLENWSDGTGFQWVSGYMPPFVTVDEAAEEGADSVVLRGFEPSAEYIITAGDLGEVRPNGIPTSHSHLYEVVSNSRIDDNGRTRVYISPGLRKDVAAGDQWVLRYPTGVFELASDSEGSFSRGLANLANFGLTLNEKLPWQ